MARLIDADALKEEMRAGCVPIDLGGITGVTGDDDSIEDYIDAAPTIAAIPMWWITEKFLDVLNKDKELSKAVWLVRKVWLEEQEANDT